MIVSRGAMRQALLERPQDDMWRAVLGWSRTLAPFWAGAIESFAAVKETPATRLDLYRHVVDTAFDRMDDWWHGRVKLVKARRNEIDSAISFIRNTALHGEVASLIQAPVARHAAGALRGTLHLATGSYAREQMSGVVAGLVYDWACCRALFPGDPSVLIRHLPAGILERTRHLGNAPEAFDDRHLLFDEPADRFGLRTEADAVYAEAARIWASFDNPLPWNLPDDIWSRRYDGGYQRMHHESVRAFHGR